jgi:hypothetical protein
MPNIEIFLTISRHPTLKLEGLKPIMQKMCHTFISFIATVSGMVLTANINQALVRQA